MFFRQQLEGIEIEFVRRLAIGMDHFAIDDELDLCDFGLPAGIDRDHFSFGDIFLRRRFKIIGHDRGQGSDLKLGAQPADITLDIGNGNIKPMLARLFLDRLDGEGLFRRNNFAIKGDFDAFDVLIGADLDGDVRIFRQGLGEEIIGQEEQGHRNRRAQRGAA